MRRRLATGFAVALVALVAGLFVGLGTGSHGEPAPSPTLAPSTATGAGTLSQTVATEPSVTQLPTLTTPADQLPGYGKPTIMLGDMNTPEQFVIGQLYLLALQQQGYNVSLSRNVSLQSVALAAFHLHTLTLFPDYLDIWNSRVAHLRRRFNSLASSYATASRYADAHGFKLLPPTPFSDTWGVAVSSQYAQVNHVHTLPQLARGPRIIFAAPLDYITNPHGLAALKKAYGLHPGYVQTVTAIGAQYVWLDSGDAQAAWVNTTDPQLLGPEFELLKDPKHVFGYGNVVAVTTPEAIRAEGPAFVRTIKRVDATLTVSAMRGLNWEVEVAGKLPSRVAAEFLQGQGILPPSRFAPVPTATTPTEVSSTTATTPAPAS
ncbi:MAG: glycine betaine ABC transporter substrate-binding protein [Solirubrobacteraceae bacterium]